MSKKEGGLCSCWDLMPRAWGPARLRHPHWQVQGHHHDGRAAGLVTDAGEAFCQYYNPLHTGVAAVHCNVLVAQHTLPSSDFIL